MPNLTISSSESEVFDICRPILQPIYEALEAAAPKAADLIVQNGWPRTMSLFCHLVRAEVKTALQGKACPIEYDEIDRTMVMHAVGNEGLATNYEGITIRVWRGKNLPKAQTQSKLNFYQHSFPASFWTTSAVFPIQSLVVLWSCDEDGSNLTVSLCCPDGSADKYKWLRVIPHPSEWMIVLSSRESDLMATDDFDDILNEDEDKQKKNG